MPFTMDVWSLSFLDENHVLLLTAPLPTGPLSFNIVDCSEEAHDPYYTFLLPQFAHNVDVRALSVYSDTSPTWKSPPHATPPFRISHTDRLIVIEITLLFRGGEIRICNVGWIEVRFVIPSWVLRSHIDKHRNAKEGVEIPWDEWGPTGCRVIDYVWDKTPCSSYGTSYASKSDDGVLEMFDFNRFAGRRLDTLGSWEEGVECELVKGTTESHHMLFVDPVFSSLPYIKYKTQLQVPEETNLSEDSVLLVSRQPVSDCLPFMILNTIGNDVRWQDRNFMVSL